MDKFDLAPTLGLRTFADLKKQHGFKQNVKLTPELKDSAVVVEPYNMPESIPCGLTCRQGHNRGYLVRLSDGVHTNVGWKCGSNHFNASDFANQVKLLKKKERLEECKAQINNLIDSIPKYRRLCKKLWYEAGFLIQAIENFKRLYPGALVDELCNRSRRRRFDVSIVRQRSAVEKLAGNEDKIKSSNRPVRANSSDYVEESVGILNGVEIFSVRPRSLVKDVGRMLDEIEISSNELAEAKIFQFSRFNSQVRDQLNRAAQIIREQDRFFTPRNFALLKYLCGERLVAEVEHVDWNFEINDGRILSYGQLKRMRQKMS